MTMMKVENEGNRDRQLDEELADVLTAISVVSNRLAKKLRAISEQTMKGDMNHEKNGRTGIGAVGTEAVRGNSD